MIFPKNYVLGVASFTDFNEGLGREANGVSPNPELTPKNLSYENIFSFSVCQRNLTVRLMPIDDGVESGYALDYPVYVNRVGPAGNYASRLIRRHFRSQLPEIFEAEVQPIGIRNSNGLGQEETIRLTREGLVMQRRGQKWVHGTGYFILPVIDLDVERQLCEMDDQAIQAGYIT